MNYERIYQQIVTRAKEEQTERIIRKQNGEYFEGHHIIPKCLGGKGISRNWKHENIVGLTAREHFLCHWLLVLIYSANNKIIFAWWSMCNQNKTQQRYIPSSNVYAIAKIYNAAEMSLKFKGNKFGIRKDDTSLKCLNTKRENGTLNHSNETKIRMRNSKLGIPKSIEHKNSMSISRKGRPFSESRNKKLLGKKRPQQKIKCPHCNKEGGNAMKRWHFENCKHLI